MNARVLPLDGGGESGRPTNWCAYKVPVAERRCPNRVPILYLSCPGVWSPSDRAWDDVGSVWCVLPRGHTGWCESWTHRWPSDAAAVHVTEGKDVICMGARSHLHVDRSGGIREGAESDDG